MAQKVPGFRQTDCQRGVRGVPAAGDRRANVASMGLRERPARSRDSSGSPKLPQTGAGRPLTQQPGLGLGQEAEDQGAGP